jgi:NAD(P)H dehydrogenase (quinone)
LKGVPLVPDTVNLAVVYYSSTGTGTAIAKEVAAAAEKAGAVVRVRKVANWRRRRPSTRIRSGPLITLTRRTCPPLSTTTSSGPTSTLLALYNSFRHFGGIIVPPGYTSPVKFVDGSPYGTSHHAVSGAEPGSIDDNTRNAARHQAERVVTITRALKQGTAF